MKEGHLAYLACSSVIRESLVEGHLIWLHRATHPHAGWIFCTEKSAQQRCITHGYTLCFWAPYLASLNMIKRVELYNYFFSSQGSSSLQEKTQTQRERHIPVTRLSASLLTPWSFPDKCCCPLDSTSLSSRVMANYQEAVCWKDEARNCICLQTGLSSKHMLWNKLPSKMKCIQKNQNWLQSTMWLLRKTWTMTWEGFCCLWR